MRVTVLYFGVLRDRFGASNEVVELADGVAVVELLSILRGRTSNNAMSDRVKSDLDNIWRSIAVAVNREYSTLLVMLRDGDEVALLPPVSGGCATPKARFTLKYAVGCPPLGIEQANLSAGPLC